MKKLILIATLLFIITSNIQCRVSKRIDSLTEGNKENKDVNYSKNILIIYFEKDAKESVLEEIKKYNAKVKYLYDNFNGVAIEIPNNKTLEESEKYFKNVNGILEVNRDYIMTIQ